MSDNRPPQQCAIEKAANKLEDAAEEAREIFAADFQAMLEDPVSFYDFTFSLAMSESGRLILPRDLLRAAKRWEILLNAFSDLEEQAFEVNNGE
tara:strand:- start:1571 stop:1852 length:282 start_codon:yes stop_codon:yes gene_type:complete